jgi:Anti-sigma-28 factor, FlgM
MTVDRPDRLPASERDKVSRLKHQIARRNYRVDPEAVAREILFKLRMISLGRRTLLDSPESGGQRIAPPPSE